MKNWFSNFVLSNSSNLHCYAAGTKTTHWILSMIKRARDVDDEEVPAITKHLQEILVPMAFRDCKEPRQMAKAGLCTSRIQFYTHSLKAPGFFNP
jgi:hypothetical protein